MNTSSRFAVSIHILTLLAARPDETLTSAYIACSVNTHPVVIRRLLAVLRNAGLVASQAGSGGGWRLQRSPGEIRLSEVYGMLGDRLPFGLPRQEPNSQCDIGSSIRQALDAVFGAAEAAVETYLAQVTVADILWRIRRF